jgi:RES domain-containing protein
VAPRVQPPGVSAAVSSSISTAWRLARKRHPVYTADGARLVGGRWSSPGRSIIYAAEHYSTALLEILVHAGRIRLPGAYHAVRIAIPGDVVVEQFDPGLNPGWDIEGSEVARDYGDEWAATRRTAVLAVPSVVAQPVEWNLLLNTEHPHFPQIIAGAPFDVPWDGRLFG